MKLYVVPTPIGNLQDITLRALETLKQVDIILAEDTRTSKVLLNHFQIATPLWRYHQHNEHKVLENLIEEMQAGKTFALISDAGTPAISDPGFLLVRACIQHQIPVECLPGPTALIPALVDSGFPINRFVFEGFLPPKKGRQTLLNKLKEEERAIVFYESPHRILKTLLELKNYFEATRKICVCRELSKKFEEIVRGTLDEVALHFEKQAPRGEFVIVIEGVH
ncbi:MAG: 16S rRNA (cytidine(1402)-2'-O)-methyltransferase [Bacteroidetes bacterium]|jgi:16S rRNA (cytidine1402-2'-O)-methyltransferase|nr:16S rRNA (cytidine(1402)-2'-O)-methyltransferase [Bacteroidota bacterium]HQW45615.1 16S rRNA (cytidine(1402)-2'-O)-methyltransferase [Chitinophagaceae bacterium]MBK6819051.1 16S rRNA (cytidine(1402)-2'-O)-methyltransferase [Bacteroidota bacterium]MBK7587489.1 16S rRNA (cytidine(1402)-2'-O)-methyltransferase [Bacteroidota bacterium]MBK8329754.1 16S rRNA (cytidine(1402)-2'-O)-methyltransferase [Bacteroidota bacterium]